MLKFIDYAIIPLCIVFLLFDPNFKNGYIDHLEAGQYLSWVNGVFDGKLPYRDFFVLFGPFQIYIISFIMILFGKTLAVLRTYFYINYILSFLAIYFLSRMVCKKRVFAYIAVFICLVEVSQPFWASRWDFGRMGLGMVSLSLLVLFIKKEDWKFIFAAGVSSAFALLYSLDVGAYTTIVSLALLTTLPFTNTERGYRTIAIDIIRYSSIYAFGFICVAAPFAVFLMLRHAFIPFIETFFYIMPKYFIKTWSHPLTKLDYYGTASGFNFIGTETFKVFLPIPIYAGTLLYLAWSAFKKRWDKEKVIILILIIYSAIAYKAAFRAIESTQFQVTLPPLIIVVALFAQKLFGELTVIFTREKTHDRINTKSLAKVTVIILILILSSAYFLTSHKRYYGSFGNWIEYQKFKSRLVATYLHPIPANQADLVKASLGRLGDIMIPDGEDRQMKAVVDYITAHTAKDEEIFTFPEHGIYNFLADRPFFNKFSIAVFAWTTPEWQSELLEALRTKKPRTIIFSTRLSNHAQSIDRDEELLPDIIRFVMDNYHMTHEFGDIAIYSLNT